MPVVYDIRQQIPQFKDNYFPPYNYQPYPRMMVNKETGKPYKTKTNEFVIVGSEQEEKEFLDSVVEKSLTEKPSVAPKIKAEVFTVDAEPKIEKSEEVLETGDEPKRRGRPPSILKTLK